MDKRSRHLGLFTICIFFSSGLGVIHLASAGGQWCVASQGASSTALQSALDYACGVTDCSAIQPGATCYNPNTVRDHASYAFNQYYQKNPQPSSCVFGGVATLTSSDPSNGNCEYASSGASVSPSTPGSAPAPGSPSSKPTPTPSTPNPTTPDSPTIPESDSPPTTPSPSGATPTSSSLLVFFVCGLLASLQVAISI